MSNYYLKTNVATHHFFYYSPIFVILIDFFMNFISGIFQSHFPLLYIIQFSFNSMIIPLPTPQMYFFFLLRNATYFLLFSFASFFLSFFFILCFFDFKATGQTLASASTNSTWQNPFDVRQSISITLLHSYLKSKACIHVRYLTVYDY